MSQRRDFLAGLGVLATALMIDPEELRAAPLVDGTGAGESPWDTSWIKRVEDARYRAVFNADAIADGAAMDFAAGFLDGFHEVHATSDADTRAVIVFRRMGTPTALNDALWERYRIGEATKIDDPATHAPALRNVYWRGYAGSSPESLAVTLETLGRRGTIYLVCNIALTNSARNTARRLQLDPDKVVADYHANLIPGAILVPSGIYALIRAQNAGCAWMPGS